MAIQPEHLWLIILAIAGLTVLMCLHMIARAIELAVARQELLLQMQAQQAAPNSTRQEPAPANAKRRQSHDHATSEVRKAA